MKSPESIKTVSGIVTELGEVGDEDEEDEDEEDEEDEEGVGQVESQNVAVSRATRVRGSERRRAERPRGVTARVLAVTA
jgi:hypothetical protein